MVASEASKRYAGNVIVANSSASSVATGGSGSSAGVPGIHDIAPAFVRYNLSILPK